MEEQILPIVCRNRKHVGVGPYIPKPPAKKSSNSKQLRESLELLISECLEKEVHLQCWMMLLSNEIDNVFITLKSFNEEARNAFLSKYEEAKCVWECVLCDAIEPNKKYVYCESCSSAYHTSCVNATDTFLGWQCDDCESYEIDP